MANKTRERCCWGTEGARAAPDEEKSDKAQRHVGVSLVAVGNDEKRLSGDAGGSRQEGFRPLSGCKALRMDRGEKAIEPVPGLVPSAFFFLFLAREGRLRGLAGDEISGSGDGPRTGVGRASQQCGTYYRRGSAPTR